MTRTAPGIRTRFPLAIALAVLLSGLLWAGEARAGLACGEPIPLTFENFKACWQYGGAKRPKTVAVSVTPNSGWDVVVFRDFPKELDDFEAFSVPGGWDCDLPTRDASGAIKQVICRGPLIGKQNADGSVNAEVFCFSTGDSELTKTATFVAQGQKATGPDTAEVKGNSIVQYEDSGFTAEPPCDGTTLAVLGAPRLESQACYVAYAASAAKVSCVATARGPRPEYPVNEFDFDFGDGAFTVAATGQGDLYTARVRRQLSLASAFAMREVAITARNRRGLRDAGAYRLEKGSSRLRAGVLRCSKSVCKLRVFAPAPGKLTIRLLKCRACRGARGKLFAPAIARVVIAQPGWSDVFLTITDPDKPRPKKKPATGEQPSAEQPSGGGSAAQNREPARKPGARPKPKVQLGVPILGRGVLLVVTHTPAAGPRVSLQRRVDVRRDDRVKRPEPPESEAEETPEETPAEGQQPPAG